MWAKLEEIIGNNKVETLCPVIFFSVLIIRIFIRAILKFYIFFDWLKMKTGSRSKAIIIPEMRFVVNVKNKFHLPSIHADHHPYSFDSFISQFVC